MVAAGVLVAGLVVVVVDGDGGDAPPPSGTASVTVTADGERARPLPAGGWLGVNGANLRAARALWASPEHARALAALGPASVRLPGGSTSQYWDLEAGRFVDDEDVPPDVVRARQRDQPALDLADLAALTAAADVGTTWVVNMTTSTLEEQVEALRAAQEAGMDVTRVELGNEMWTDEDAVLAAYPRPEDYAEAAVDWAAALRAALGPDLEVAAVGFCEDRGGPRKRSWDAAVLPVVADSVDAVVCHPYVRTGLPEGATVDGEEDLAEALVTTGQRREEFARTVEDVVPGDLPVWASEWGLLEFDTQVLGTHAHALLVADHGLGLLALERVERADLHALLGAQFAVLYGGDAVLSREQPGAVTTAATTPVLGRSAMGEAAALLWRALDGADSATPLTLRGPEGEAGPATRLARAVALVGPDGTRVVAVNPGDRPLRLDGLADVAPDLTRATTLTAPLAAVVDVDGGPAPETSPLDGPAVLAPRSVTLLEP